MKPYPGLPHPADFAAPPSPADRKRWVEADRDRRPARLARLRERLAAEGLDAYFGRSPENVRYLTGFRLEDGEEKVAGFSGLFLVSASEVVLFADSRYRLQALAEAPDGRVEDVYGNLEERWPELVRGLGARRIAAEAGHLTHAAWQGLVGAAPDVELVPVEGWVEAQRAIKEPAEVERIAAASAVADRALAAIIRRIQPGAQERELALALEWEIRTGGGDGLAFPVACLAGPDAALPHGSPGAREAMRGQVLLFDFGAQVDGYRSDMTRTLFVGVPSDRDLAIYEIVARAQQASIDLIARSLEPGATPPSGRAADAAARQVIDDAGHADHFGHGTGHGIGLATHERPSLGKRAADEPLEGPTVFSVEPGIYLDGEMGVRIEDLVVFDPAAGRLDRLTSFPRHPLIVGV